jgi:hypothetical protein
MCITACFCAAPGDFSSPLMRNTCNFALEDSQTVKHILVGSGDAMLHRHIAPVKLPIPHFSVTFKIPVQVTAVNQDKRWLILLAGLTGDSMLSNTYVTQLEEKAK